MTKAIVIFHIYYPEIKVQSVMLGKKVLKHDFRFNGPECNAMLRSSEEETAFWDGSSLYLLANLSVLTLVY